MTRYIGSFDLLFIAAIERAMDFRSTTLPWLKHFGKRLQRRNEPKIVKNCGAELMGKRPQLVRRLIQNSADFLNAALQRRIDIVSDIRHRQARCEKKLAGLIMDGVSNALDFLLQVFRSVAAEPTLHPGIRGGQFRKEKGFR